MLKESNFALPNQEKEKNIWTEKIDFGNEELNQEVEKYVKNPDKFLGEGGAAKVFSLSEGRCIKLMKNRHTGNLADVYDLGNSPQEEVRIQSLLNNLKVEGVFAPRVLASSIGKEFVAIIMEEIDGDNMQMILSGKTKLPVNFDLDSFFDELEEYIDAMHELGIAHGDLYPRNILIDRKTGKGRVIDFGRSKYFSENNEKKRKMIDADLDNMEKAYALMERKVGK